MAIDRDADNTFNDAPRHILDEIARFVETERRRQFIEEADEKQRQYIARLELQQHRDSARQMREAEDEYNRLCEAYLMTLANGGPVAEPETDWQGLFDKVIGDNE